MPDNPWIANEFYEGGFFTSEPEYDVTDPLRDQRQAILMEIEGITQMSVLVLNNPAFGGVGSGPTVYQYYYIDTNGDLQGDFLLENFGHTDKQYQYVGGAPPPDYLVFTDNTGELKYLTGTIDPVAFSVGNLPTNLPKSGAHFVGDYLEMVGENGIDIYRISISFPFTLNIDLHRTDPERVQSITLSNGHPWAFRNGRTFIEALVELGDVETHAPVSDLGYSGLVEPRIGIIRISLHEGDFDFLAEQDWEGRNFTVWIGSTDEPINLYPIAIRGQIQSADWDQNVLSLHVRDSGILFDRPMQTNTYAGTGGLEGGEELEGRVKPLIYGVVYLPEPIEVNKDLHIYQFHDGPMHEIGSPHQGGVVLANQGDFPGTLETWDPTQQQVDDGVIRTDLSIGMMRLAAPPGGRVGAFYAIGDTGLPIRPRLEEVIRRIIETKTSGLTIHANTFGAFAASYPDDGVGIYVKEETTVRDTLTQLIHSVGGLLSLSRLNRVSLRTGLREEPVAFLTDADLHEDSTLRRSPAPAGHSQHRFGFLRAWTQYTESDWLGQANPTIKQYASEEFRYLIGGPYPDPIARKFPSGSTVTIPTFFENRLHIARYASHLWHREQTYLHVYFMTVENYSWKFHIGDVIMMQFVDTPRWGFDVPRMGLIVGVTERSPTNETENLTHLAVWC